MVSHCDHPFRGKDRECGGDIVATWNKNFKRFPNFCVYLFVRTKRKDSATSSTPTTSATDKAITQREKRLSRQPPQLTNHLYRAEQIARQQSHAIRCLQLKIQKAHAENQALEAVLKRTDGIPKTKTTDTCRLISRDGSSFRRKRKNLSSTPQRREGNHAKYFTFERNRTGTAPHDFGPCVKAYPHTEERNAPDSRLPRVYGDPKTDKDVLPRHACIPRARQFQQIPRCHDEPPTVLYRSNWFDIDKTSHDCGPYKRAHRTPNGAPPICMRLI